MDFEYYYNDVPGQGLCRNNLIYTSLISTDKKTFVQHYVNDTDYHKGKNQVVDLDKMAEKWGRELCYLNYMSEHATEFVPKILDINLIEKKIYLEIDGVDFWQQANCDVANYDKVLPDWQEQMLAIINKHRELGLYKYSLHPSSYFIVDGKLKSINYFFTYSEGEGPITVQDHLSHISEGRQSAMRPITDAMGIDWNAPQTLHTMQMLTFASFSNNYPSDFTKKAKDVYL